MEKASQLDNQIRIIGGMWRGRKIRFPDVPSIRPTPDRVRETLFNWLSDTIIDSRCLDLFAGSGALGFEALSRGAKMVTALEENKKIADSILENAKYLGTDAIEVINWDALKWLRTQTKTSVLEAYDIVFLDPPYQEALLPECMKLLHDRHWVKEGSLVYMEHNAALLEEDFPSHWAVLKEKKAGHVFYYLIKA